LYVLTEFSNHRLLKRKLFWRRQPDDFFGQSSRGAKWGMPGARQFNLPESVFSRKQCANAYPCNCKVKSQFRSCSCVIPVVQSGPRLDKFYLPVGIWDPNMFKLPNLLLLLAFFSVPALPALAQDAAFDAASASSSGQADTRSAQQMPRPVAGVATNQNSNMQHWSHFSQSSASPFLRVPAGTKIKGAQANVSHYLKPQCVEPGSVRAAAQPQKGPVKRYLAYNVQTQAAEPVKSKAAAAPAKKTAARQTIALGYGRKIGEVTYSTVSNWSGTKISCYGRYR
jgi:hypothetical protein